MLVNWAVGEDAPVYLPGTAKRIPAGSTLIFQVHYTTNGKPGAIARASDSSSRRNRRSRRFAPASIANPVFAIPAGAANHEVEAEATFAERREGLDDAPAHAPAGQGHDLHRDLSRRSQRDRAAGAEVRLRLADRLLAGRAAHAAEGIEAARARALRQLGGQPGNPDPDRTVRWGDQTWEEMMIGFFTYTVEPRTAQARALLTDRPASSR